MSETGVKSDPAFFGGPSIEETNSANKLSGVWKDFRESEVYIETFYRYIIRSKRGI